MPNKESFTFSDKLRKSKSVPLSKRLPSIVGGQNKQKRTLVQRAQRDLPFILVAALALLLLPFLSRTGSDDIASTDNIAWNTMADAPSFAEGGGADIMPEGSMQDPMKWIIGLRNDVKESGATVGTDATKSAYGSGSDSGSSSRYGSKYGDDSGSGYASSRRSTYSSGSSTTKTPAKSDYNTRKKYDESYTETKTKKAPATSTYGKKTRPAVRKSFERKGTEINRALRISQMSGGKGGGGISHTLPIGQGPTRGSSGGFREGVRPIALQPMESRGNVGRSMTGENLYAEASRSIGAMNAGGPAKANLLAAQMRDVDGRLTPDGVLGGPGSGASVRPGSGGGPGNNNAYGLQKPWWWDMMNTRSQKMWDLMYYKPREMFYSNLYKVGLGIFNCLLTGDKGGDVSSFFGKGGNSDDLKCTTKKMQSFKKFVQTAPTTKTTSKDGVKEEQYDTGLAQLWFELCPKKPDGTPGWEAKETDDKNMFQVRAECLGLDVLIDSIKGWVKKEYKSDCNAVTIDGINNYHVEVHKTVFGKERERENERLNKKAVIALLAKRTDKGVNYDNIKTPEQSLYDSNEYVVAAINSQSFSMTREQIKQWEEEHPYCELTGIISFISRDGIWGNRVSRQLRTDEDSKELHNRENAPRTSVNRSSDTAPGTFFHPYASGVNFSLEYCQEKDPNSRIKKRALTFQELKTKLDPKKDSVNQCPIPSPEKHVDIMLLDGEFCYDYSPIPSVLIDHKSKAEAIIPNPEGSYVYAIVVEELSELSVPSVRDIVRYSDGDKPISRAAAERYGEKHLGYKYDKDEKAFHFYYTPHIGTEGAVAYSAQTRASQSPADAVKGKGAKSNETSTPPTTEGEVNEDNGNYQGNAVRGEGKIFWIVTKQANLLETIKPGPLNGKTLNSLAPKDFVSDHANSGVCRYWWCKDVTDCDDPKEHGCPANHMFNYCQENGNAYLYETIVIKGKSYNLKLSETPEKLQNIKITDLPECHNLCKGSDGVHPCNPDGTSKEEEPICKLNEIGTTYLGMIKTCPVCCNYKDKCGNNGNYLSVEADGKYYIIDADPKKCGKRDDKVPCSVAAWSEPSDTEEFNVYTMSSQDYNCEKLPLTPETPSTPGNPFTLASSGTYTTTLNVDTLYNLNENEHVFDNIHQQAKDSGKPKEFTLFPQLTLPPAVEIPEINLGLCSFCEKPDYLNVYVTPKDADVNNIASNIKACLDEIKKLKDALPAAQQSIVDEKLGKLYFYGYASLRGSHDPNMVPGDPKVGCITNTSLGNGATMSPIRKKGAWESGYEGLADCNYALSEDRILYIMDSVIGKLSRDYPNTETENINKYSTKNGFDNVAGRGVSLTGDPTYRLDKGSLSNLSLSGGDFTFVSRPCGSDDASEPFDASKADGLKDRYVVITLIGDDDQEKYCQNRMNCDGRAERQMKALVDELNSALGTTKIKFEI